MACVRYSSRRNFDDRYALPLVDVVASALRGERLSMSAGMEQSAVLAILFLVVLVPN